jgi:hypothetical protein
VNHQCIVGPRARDLERRFDNVVVQELGEPWAEEYLTSYKLACGYTHGAPGAVLFPLYAPQGDASAFKRADLERTALLAAVSMKLMERTFLLYARSSVERIPSSSLA